MRAQHTIRTDSQVQDSDRAHCVGRSIQLLATPIIRTLAVGWVCSMVAVGYFLGNIPGIADNIDAIVIIIVGISVLPIIISWLNQKRKK